MRGAGRRRRPGGRRGPRLGSRADDVRGARPAGPRDAARRLLPRRRFLEGVQCGRLSGEQHRLGCRLPDVRARAALADGTRLEHPARHVGPHRRRASLPGPMHRLVVRLLERRPRVGRDRGCTRVPGHRRPGCAREGGGRVCLRRRLGCLCARRLPRHPLPAAVRAAEQAEDSRDRRERRQGCDPAAARRPAMPGTCSRRSRTTPPSARTSSTRPCRSTACTSSTTAAPARSCRTASSRRSTAT